MLIATAAAADAEMAERIAEHQGARGPHWRVVEEEIDVANALKREAGEDRIVLVDCLTLWLSNLMMNGKDVDLAGEMLARSLSSLPGAGDLGFQRGWARESYPTPRSRGAFAMRRVGLIKGSLRIARRSCSPRAWPCSSNPA